MARRASTTTPPRTRRRSEPSPSTRVRCPTAETGAVVAPAPAEAGIAAAPEGGADGAAAGARHRAQAGLAEGDDDAHRAGALAGEADRLVRQARPAPRER